MNTVSFEDVETDLLNGQRLPGADSCRSIWECIHSAGIEHEFPLFARIYEILELRKKPEELFPWIR